MKKSGRKMKPQVEIAPPARPRMIATCGSNKMSAIAPSKNKVPFEIKIQQIRINFRKSRHRHILSSLM